MHKPLVIAILGALVLGLGIFQSSIYAVANAQEETERRQLPEGPYVPGNLIVKFRPDIRAEEADIMRSAMGATVVRRFPLIGAELWQMDDRVAEQALRQYGGDRRFEYVEPDYIIKLEQAPNDPDLPQMWGLNNTGQTGGTLDADIDAPEAWDINAGSSSVVIAVVDTGVQVATTQALALGCLENVPAHPDLAANLWVNPGEIPGDGLDNDSNGLVDDIHGWNFFDDAAGLFCTDSEDYHGTHVAGIIAARGNNSMGVTGVNWQAQIMVLKFIGPFGGPTSAAISAIEYATNKGAKVINASWGGPQDQESQALKAAIEACNCLFVAAAGNGGSDGIGDDNDQIPDHPSGFDSANIIAVASTDHNDNLAPFSNFGVTSVDLCAPGTSILSTLPTSDYGSYGPLSGTSMAAPHVSGVAGLVLSEFPGLTPTQVKQRILNGTDPISACNGKTVSGGRLNAQKALVDVVNSCQPPASGNWTIPADQTCTLTQNAVIIGSVIVESNATLTITSGASLNIDFTNHHLKIKNGAKVIIQNGGRIE